VDESMGSSQSTPAHVPRSTLDPGTPPLPISPHPLIHLCLYTLCLRPPLHSQLPPLPYHLPPLHRSNSVSAPSASVLPPFPDIPSDDPIQALLAAFSQLPDTIGQSHRHLQGSLASLASDCNRLLESLQEACRRAATDAAESQV
jgi:hypothetical protein